MKFLFLSLICLLPFTVQSQTGDMRRIDKEDMLDIRQVLDTKLFHDRFFVEKMVQDFYEQEKSGINSNPSLMKEIGHEGLFNDRDAALLRYELADRVVRTKLIQTPWKEQVKLIREDPFEAFVGLIENQEVSALKQEDINDLNSIDKKIIPQTLQMLTESGPDIGASPVSVIYNENTILQ